MPRSPGPLRTLFFVLVAGLAGLLLGLGAFSVASALGAGQEQNLGDPVRFDPAKVTVTPSPNPTMTPTMIPTMAPTLNPLPEQVVPAPPSPADDDPDDNDPDDDSDDGD
jgi:hypothetical protein